ncbi:hypothetical protein V6R21_01745 [Limibacter armeniacum]|uniref:hypothetical protein n=1 Tax=Limibacter armeniacum TaxID=466084 RepID=UPI002FE542F6
MQIEKYLQIATACFNIMLSPYGLILFLLCFSSNKDSFFEHTGVNTAQLKKKPYLIYLFVFTSMVLAISYMAGHFLAPDFDIWQIYLPKYYWLSCLSWGVTIVTTRTYFKGMEGNIMGFIFFPMLAITSMALFVVNISDIFHFSSQIKTPLVNTKYFWWGFLGHMFLPFQCMLFMVEIKNGKAKGDGEWLTPLIGGLIFQLLCFVLHWVVVKIFGQGLTFAQFFGEGQSLLYFIPMLGGFLYYLFYILKPQGDTKLNWLSYGITILTLLLVVLQVFNYINMLKSWF